MATLAQKRIIKDLRQIEKNPLIDHGIYTLFNENNINELIADFELVLDDSLAFAVTPDFASDEVNRRVFCSC